MKIRAKHTTYYEVDVSPKEALYELERLLFIRAGIQGTPGFRGYYPIYINKEGQIVENDMKIEPRVLVDKPTKRQLELFQAFETLKREIEDLNETT